MRTTTNLQTQVHGVCPVCHRLCRKTQTENPNCPCSGRITAKWEVTEGGEDSPKVRAGDG
jgi:hypothetical protein